MKEHIFMVFLVTYIKGESQSFDSKILVFRIDYVSINEEFPLKSLLD